MNADSVIEKLRELVIDENRIVTYKTLSKVCSIHVNDAKKSLEKFLDAEKDLNSSYILSGFVKNVDDSQECGYHVAVVPADKLEKVRTKFSSLHSCHVYSIQKSKIKDSSVLYSANSEELTDQVKERPKAVIQNPSLESARRSATIVNKPKAAQHQKKEVVENNKSITNGIQTVKEEINIKDVKNQQKPLESKVKGKSVKNAEKTGIMAAFARGSAATKKESTPKEKENVTPSPKHDQKRKAEKSGSLSDETVATKKSGSKSDLKKAQKQMWDSSESSSDEVVSPTPKRAKTMKRIKQLPDSDSEEDNNSSSNKNKVSSQDSEEPIPTSVKELISDEEDDDGSEDVIPPTPESAVTRQVVTETKTYVDEDGFLVTRKERKVEELELPKSSPVSAKRAPGSSPPTTQARSVPETKTNNLPQGKQKKTKTAPDNSKKQASLMSFFTKK